MLITLKHVSMTLYKKEDLAYNVLNLYRRHAEIEPVHYSSPYDPAGVGVIQSM